MRRPKVAVVGAGGNVGASVAQWIAAGELADLALIDLKGPVAQGKGLDLFQCGPFGGFHAGNMQSGSDFSLLEGADVVVMTAGVPRKPGQSREELIGVNTGIVKGICAEVRDRAPEAILIVVSNPLDAMVFVAKHTTGFPRERVLGSAGVLDSSRFRSQIALTLGVCSSDVSAMVLGAHTDKDMVPIVSTAVVGGIPLTQMATPAQIAEIVEHTKKGGAELTALIGTSAWLAPGCGTTAMVDACIKGKGRILPCSVELQGEFGVRGAFIGVPVQLSSGGLSKVWEVKLSAEEAEAFHKSVAVNKELMEIAKTFL